MSSVTGNVGADEPVNVSRWPVKVRRLKVQGKSREIFIVATPQKNLYAVSSTTRSIIP